MKTTSDKLIRIEDMAHRLGVCPAWLDDEAAAGRIPHLVAGSVVLVSPAAVERALLARAESTPAPTT